MPSKSITEADTESLEFATEDLEGLEAESTISPRVISRFQAKLKERLSSSEA